jgi:hypothetical protein
MERAEVLLEKLKSQLREKAGRDQLLLTLRLLYEEIMASPVTGRQPSSGKVSVILPTTPSFVFPDPSPFPAEEKIVETLQVDEAEIEAELRAIKESAELKNELSIKARAIPVDTNDRAEEIPTLASHMPYLPADAHMPAKEDRPEPPPQKTETLKFPAQEPSLNDRLRAAQKVLAEQLQEAPVKDIRKAIGINDRYLFINELFQGNEAMFERSLKTLNAFTILPEAEFWMQRELQVKLGWKDDEPLVQQFIQLIKRRFS